MEAMPVGVSAFFIQLLVILVVARIVGWLAIQVGQPRVVGEMIAGILLGPTLFGALAPEFQQQLFSADYRPFLSLGAQVGIGLYMFLVGLEFDTSMFKPGHLMANCAGCDCGLYFCRSCGLLPGCAALWREPPYGACCRYFDERTWHDGTDFAQYCSAKWRD